MKQRTKYKHASIKVCSSSSVMGAFLKGGGSSGIYDILYVDTQCCRSDLFDEPAVGAEGNLQRTLLMLLL